SAGLARLGKQPTETFRTRKPYPRALLKALRLHQWLKNVLVFIPMVAAHRVGDAATWYASLPMFLAYGMVASSIYVVNDLMDIDSDRVHPRKRNRPFAAGDLSVLHGLAIAPVLLVAGVALAFSINVLAGLMVL